MLLGSSLEGACIRTHNAAYPDKKCTIYYMSIKSYTNNNVILYISVLHLCNMHFSLCYFIYINCYHIIISRICEADFENASVFESQKAIQLFLHFRADVCFPGLQKLPPDSALESRVCPVSWSF